MADFPSIDHQYKEHMEHRLNERSPSPILFFNMHVVPATKSAVVRIDSPGEVYCPHEILFKFWTGLFFRREIKKN